jgi:hypothetical protein
MDRMIAAMIPDLPMPGDPTRPQDFVAKPSRWGFMDADRNGLDAFWSVD